jgi:hypothetical protein
MSEPTDKPNPPGVIYIEPSSFAADHLEARDYIYALEVDFDIDAQLMAISGLLHRNRNADQSMILPKNWTSGLDGA